MRFEREIKKEKVVAVQDKFYRRESVVALLNQSVNEAASKVLAEKAIDAQIKFDAELTDLLKELLGDLFNTFKCSYGVDFDTNIAWVETNVAEARDKMLSIGFTEK